MSEQINIEKPYSFQQISVESAIPACPICGKQGQKTNDKKEFEFIDERGSVCLHYKEYTPKNTLTEYTIKCIKDYTDVVHNPNGESWYFSK